MTLIRFLLALVAALLLTPAHAREPAAAPAAPRGVAIASAHHLATEAGLAVLAEGGTACDAAVAVSAVLSVVEPISSGIGGGGFVLWREAASGRDIFIDGREVAPAAATLAEYRTAEGKPDRERAVNGPWSAGIPGQPALWVHLSQRCGKLPLTRTLAPAIRIAEQGFPIYARLAEGYAVRKDVMERYAGSRAVFLADGDPPEVGEIFRQPDLANTLRAVAERGFDGFYRGDVARRLVRAVNREGGRWTRAELAAYRVKEREPLRLRYRGWDIVTAPPPSSGGVALAQILQIISGWDWPRLSEVDRVHLSVEAMRRAYRDRSIYLGDPDFVQVPLARLLSRDYAAGLRAGIRADKATPSALLPGQPAPLEDEETTHFSIIDGEGNLIASTQTVNLYYGSGLVADGTGVLLNNEMDDFALYPGEPNAFGVMGFEANAPAPGKRMLSSMTPTIMTSPERVAVLGTPGGSRIITMVLLGILGVDAGLDPQAVTALPRYHHQYLPDAIGYEPGAFSPELIAALQARGHTVTAGRDTWGNFQAVDWNLRSGELRAGSDPRNEVGRGEARPATATTDAQP